MRVALPLAAEAAPGCRARGEECRGSLCRSEHRAPLAAREANLTGAGRGSTRTTSGASAAVARRAARRARFCAELLFVFLSWMLLPTGFVLGILNSRTAPLRYPRSRIRNQNVKKTKAEKVLCADKIRVRSLRRFRDSWGAKPDFFDAFLNFFERRREGHAIENPRCFHGSNRQVKDLEPQLCRVRKAGKLDLLGATECQGMQFFASPVSAGTPQTVVIMPT